MKILILSDSHGTIRYMINAVLQERPDYVIHLGDHSRDAARLQQEYPMLPIVGVRGNCDYGEFDLPEQRLVEYFGVRILMSHGHRHGVKSGLLRYSLCARENQADVAVFGHTHCAYCEEGNGFWLLNPGSCGYGSPTCGVVEINHGQAVCTVKPIAESEEFV